MNIIPETNVVPAGHITSSVVPTREQRDKRVAIAKDILLQLGRADNPLRLESAYIYGMVPIAELTDDLQGCVEAIQRKCQVCQLGAALLSKARLFDDVATAKIAQPGDHERTEIKLSREMTTRLLGDIFDDEMMTAMEAAFEAEVIDEDVENWDYAYSAEDFARGKGDTERMRAVCRNIIDNDGLFVVPLSLEDDEDDEDDALDDPWEDEDDDLDDDEEEADPC